MALLTLRDVTVGFGGPVLLDHVNLSLHDGERICLLGRNGSGKSTLLKLIDGRISPDDGEVSRRQGLKIATLVQDVPDASDDSVFEVVAAGLAAHEADRDQDSPARQLAEFEHINRQLAREHSDALLARLAAVQQRLEQSGAWQLHQKVAIILTRMQLDGAASFAALSGGMKRRVLLAQALVRDPELLLLDEPTNHLDLAGIRWLEEFLAGYGGTLLFISHDRSFIRRLATRILDLDRGVLSSWDCDFDSYLQRKQQALDAEEAQQREFDKKLAREEAWIRQGIKARRTRNEGRVRTLQQLRATRRARRDRVGQANLRVDDSQRSGRLVVTASHIGHAYDGQTLIRDFSIEILRGDRIGIIGPNGAGKSTLINILLGRLAPQHGQVRLGTQLEIAYFDQLRSQLDETRSVADNVADGSHTVTIDGQDRHIIGYLQDFLFTPERARSPVSALSGGEKNRLLLARLFARPANVLVMDEPTNDLDIETLELLEELLLAYRGTLLLVSHDRSFLNNVVTSILALEGDGVVREYIGNYDDWLRQSSPKKTAAPGQRTPEQPPNKNKTSRTTDRPRKLGYREQRELTSLPERIEQLEAEQQALTARMSDPAFYQSRGDEVQACTQRLAALGEELEQAYQRWEELESIRNN